MSDMNDFDVLRDRLIALAGPPSPREDAARVFELSESQTALSAFVQEVLETRLPRQLTFKNDTGAQLTFTAGSGRLVSLDTTSFPVTSDMAFPQSLSSQDADTVALASVLLNRLVAEASRLTVASSYLPKGSDISGLGIKPNLLTMRSKNNIVAAVAAKDFDRLLTQIEADSDAWVVLRAGQIDAIEGAEDQRARLAKLVETLDPAEHGDVPGLHCVLLSTQDDADFVLCASEEEMLAFAIMPLASKATMLETWRTYSCVS